MGRVSNLPSSDGSGLVRKKWMHRQLCMIALMRMVQVCYSKIAIKLTGRINYQNSPNIFLYFVVEVGCSKWTDQINRQWKGFCEWSLLQLIVNELHAVWHRPTTVRWYVRQDIWRQSMTIFSVMHDLSWVKIFVVAPQNFLTTLKWTNDIAISSVLFTCASHKFQKLLAFS